MVRTDVLLVSIIVSLVVIAITAVHRIVTGKGPL
jgi:hypothetical protein